MCGIVGFLAKRPGSEHPVGQTLLAMLQALSCRGPDSAGVAVFTPPGRWRLRLSAPAGLDDGAVTAALRELGMTSSHQYGNGVHDAALASRDDTLRAELRIRQRLPGTEVMCLGQRLELFKQVGSPGQLEATYHVSALAGTHGIGHTRLSTESRVDLSHSQPFWAHGVPDLATVHNGHITNYHKLRRHYEQQGQRFYTENDSEVIGVYLRDRMTRGLSLEDALRSSLDDFDGSFSYLVASADCLAYVKDRFGFKPLMLAETDDFVALATEEVALRQALGRDFLAREPAPGTMRVWQVKQEVAHAGAGTTV
jgi:methylamine---glutamate N-methyltransferase subunit A